MRTAKSLASISREIEEALLAACDDNDVVSARAWIGLGANMNMICESGRTPLCAAAQAGHVEIVQAMVDNAMRPDDPGAVGPQEEAQEYSTDSEMSEEDDIWFSEEASSSGDSIHSGQSVHSDHSDRSEHSLNSEHSGRSGRSRRSRRSMSSGRSGRSRRSRRSRRSVSSERSERSGRSGRSGRAGRSRRRMRSSSGSLSCTCNESCPNEMCECCAGNFSPHNSDVDVESLAPRSHRRRNKRMRRRSPAFENVRDDLNDGVNELRDDSGTDESDCLIELYRRHVQEYFNDIQGLRLRRHANARDNLNQEIAAANPANSAAVVVALVAAVDSAAEDRANGIVPAGAGFPGGVAGGLVAAVGGAADDLGAEDDAMGDGAAGNGAAGGGAAGDFNAGDDAMGDNAAGNGAAGGAAAGNLNAGDDAMGDGAAGNGAAGGAAAGNLNAGDDAMGGGAAGNGAAGGAAAGDLNAGDDAMGDNAAGNGAAGGAAAGDLNAGDDAMGDGAAGNGAAGGAAAGNLNAGDDAMGGGAAGNGAAGGAAAGDLNAGDDAMGDNAAGNGAAGGAAAGDLNTGDGAAGNGAAGGGAAGNGAAGGAAAGDLNARDDAMDAMGDGAAGGAADGDFNDGDDFMEDFNAEDDFMGDFNDDDFMGDIAAGDGAAGDFNDGDDFMGDIAAEGGAAEDGAAGENPEAPNDDDFEGGYIEVVEHVENDFQDVIDYYPRGYIFGIFDTDDLDGLEVVSSSSDDSLVHYAFRFGRHGLMSSNPLYHASPWRSGVFSKTNCLTRRIPNPKSLNKKDHFGSRPIHYAIVGGHVDVLRILVTSGCKVNVGDEEKLFPLHMAAARDIPQEIELLIRAGAHINVRTIDKVTPLHVAASRGLLENVKILVQNGARVNVFDKFNRSPLYMAVMTHHKEIVSYLLTKNATVDMEEVHGYTPLFEALTQRNVGMLRILAAAGANVNQSPSILHQAVSSRNEAIVREVLEAGCMVNGREENGDTALMVAARTMQPKIIKILLEYGAAVDITNPRSGEGPLMQMMRYIRGNARCFKETFPLFLNHGLEMDCELAYKCFQQAIFHGEDGIGALLIRRGAISFSNIPEIYSQLATDLFYEIVIRESWLLVKLFIYAGFNFRKLRLVSNSPSIIVQWIEKQKTSPLKLSELCRIVVRSKLGNKVFERVCFLNIPTSIQSYVKLDNVT